MSRGRAGALLAAIMAVGAALRWWAFAGISGAYLADDTRYAMVAQNLANGHPPAGVGEWFGARAVFLWPVALAFRLWGAGDLTAVAWPLLCSTATIGAAYLVAAELSNRRVALLAAALLAAAPLEVLQASRLRPDAVMPLFIALAVWCGLRSRFSAVPLRWALAAGVMMGAAWSAREMALVMVPIVIAAGGRPRWRTLVAGAAGVVAVVAVVAAGLWRMGGDPAMPLTGTAGASHVRAPWQAYRWDGSYLRWALDHALSATHPAFLALPVIAAAAVVLVRVREPRGHLAFWWAAWGLVYLEFVALTNLTPSPRFLTLVSVPLAVAVALAATYLPRGAPWVVPAVALVAAAAAAAPVAERTHRDLRVKQTRAVVEWLREHGVTEAAWSPDYVVFTKLAIFRTQTRLEVPRAVDPGLLNDAERSARRVQPLPPPSSFRGGVVVELRPPNDDGAPSNWSRERREARRVIPRAGLVELARMDDVVIARWPADVASPPR